MSFRKAVQEIGSKEELSLRGAWLTDLQVARSELLGLLC